MTPLGNLLTVSAALLWAGVFGVSGMDLGTLGNSADQIEKLYPGTLMPVPTSTLNTVKQLLLGYVNQRQVPTPSGVLCSGCLFSSWQRRSGSGHVRRFAFSQLNNAMLDYPSQVRDKMRVLLYTPNGSTNFENFDLTIANTHAVKKSYMGVARRVNDIVDVALVSSDLAANLVQKYVTLSKRTCKKILWVKKCKTHHYTEPRGYYANEVTSMKAMLESETFRMFQSLASRLAA